MRRRSYGMKITAPTGLLWGGCRYRCERCCMLDQAKMPSRMAKLPRDARGYPVPRFVSWYDGKPDFRIADTRYLEHCFRARTCWLCGELLGRYLAFVIGPMCAVNRTTAEPPCHRDRS